MRRNIEASWMGIQASGGRLLQRAARWMLHGQYSTMAGGSRDFLQYRWKWPRDKFLQLLSNRRRANRPGEYCESSVSWLRLTGLWNSCSPPHPQRNLYRLWNYPFSPVSHTHSQFHSFIHLMTRNPTPNFLLKYTPQRLLRLRSLQFLLWDTSIRINYNSWYIFLFFVWKKKLNNKIVQFLIFLLHLWKFLKYYIIFLNYFV